MTNLSLPLAPGNAVSPPAWHAFDIPCFGGRTTLKGTGKHYLTMRLAQLFTAEPLALPKIDGPAIIPSTYCGDDARVHAVQRKRGQFVALTGDIDEGDHPLGVIEAAVWSFAGDAAQSIYSSPSSRPGHRKWRIIIPLAAAVGFETWHAAQTLFHHHLAGAGIKPDPALRRAGQIVFAPNIPSIHEGSGTPLRMGGSVDGAPLYFERWHSSLDADGLDLAAGSHALDILLLTAVAHAEDAQRRAADNDAKRRRAERTGNSSTPIERFNQANDLNDLLVKYGYENAPDREEDWRSPQQKSGSYATQAHNDDDGRQWWVSLSGSDRAAGLGRECASGSYGDAFDLFVYYEHRGHLGSALAELQIQEALADFADLDLSDLPPLPQPAANGSKFRLQSLDELEHEAPRKLVIKGLVGCGDLGCIFGQPGAGKSVLGPYLAFRVAQGLPVFGMKTIAGPVIYVGAEDAHGMGRRLRALRKVYGESNSVHLATGLAGMMADLQSPEMQDLLQCIARLKPALVVIDTLAVGFPIDENASREMGAVVQICRTITEQGSAVILIHHSPKGDSSTPRGHSILNGALDVSIKVEPADTAGVIRCACMKNRNGFQQRFGFKIRSEVLGFDDDGDEISAPACEEVDLRSLPKDMKLSGAKLAALTILDSIAGDGERANAAAWRTRCIAPGMLSDAESEKSRSDMFGRAKRELLTAKLIVGGTNGAGEWIARCGVFRLGDEILLPDF